MKKKSQVWISAVLYTLVAVLALVLILEAGLPILERLRDRAAFTKSKDIMLNLDKHIQDVASEGEGSQRIVSMDIKDGKLSFSNNQVVWEMKTKQKIIEPRTSTSVGNLLITSNANVQTIENPDHYIMRTKVENDTFEVRINKTCCKTSWSSIETGKLVDYISFNDIRMDGTFNFSLNNDPSSTYGTGYTEMIPSGNRSNLGRAKVVAHIDSSFAEYDLEIILESYSDFITTKIKNFVAKS